MGCAPSECPTILNIYTTAGHVNCSRVGEREALKIFIGAGDANGVVILVTDINGCAMVSVALIGVWLDVGKMGSFAANAGDAIKRHNKNNPFIFNLPFRLVR
jgi:hypothetical protein